MVGEASRMSRIGIIAAFIALSAFAAEASAQGLYGEYYEQTVNNTTEGNFTGAVTHSQVDGPVAFNFLGTVADPTPVGFPGGLTATNNSIRWQGMIEATQAGQHAIMPNVSPNHDEGMRIWLDGALVYDRWRGQASNAGITAGPTVTLAVGQRLAVRIDYYMAGTDAAVYLRWIPPGASQTPIPAVNLLPMVATPVITPVTGNYPSARLVTLRNHHVGTTIRYTLDGSAPNPAGGAPTIDYTGPFLVSATTTIRAIAVKTGMTTSSEATATLTVSNTQALTVSSITTPQTDTRLFVRFSEPVQTASAQTMGNYTIVPALAISNATLLPDAQTVVLTTAAMADDTVYTLAVSNVQDLQGTTIANTTYSFRFQSLSTGLIHYWAMDEGTGTAVGDSVGIGSGTMQGNAPSWIPGVVGNALDFNGFNHSVLTGADLKDNLDDAISVVGWFLSEGRPQAKGGQYAAPSIFGQDNGNNVNEVFLGWQRDTGHVGMGIPHATAGQLVGSQSAAPLTLIWTHLVFIRDQAAGQSRIYFNGAQVDQDAGGLTTGNILGANTNFNRFGVQLGSTGGIVGQSNWIGGMDELRVYNTVLSAADVYHFVNVAPVVTFPVNPISAAFGANVVLDATVADTTIPPGGGLVYAWTQLSGTAVTINNANQVDANVTFNAGGTFVFRLTVSDGQYTSSADLTVNIQRLTISGIALTTSETGTTANFTITATTAPAADVTINLTGLDATEGSLSLTTVTLNAGNLSQQVTVTGLDDAVNDGDILYTITTQPSVSTDANFSGIDLANVAVTNTDNDAPGISVTGAAGLVVTEGGTSVTFNVVLQSEPTGNVTIPVSAGNGEITVGPANLVFTPTGGGTPWNVAQTVTITAVDDLLVDLTQPSSVVLGAATSTDVDYGGVNPADPGVTVIDNEAIPPPPEAWGDCGLLGVEFLLPLGLLAFRRRRKA
jgi:hypothetical protein